MGKKNIVAKKTEYWWGCNDQIYGEHKDSTSLLQDIEATLDEDKDEDGNYSEDDGYWVVEVKHRKFVAKKTKEVRLL